ncbi:hypothetical protein D5086_031683 [Populus alba]|uniref:Uncharacterized protein n=1 Tax=Populus alba TaxID=43335 RepID=A0ACC4AK69_POPAL
MNLSFWQRCDYSKEVEEGEEAGELACITEKSDHTSAPVSGVIVAVGVNIHILNCRMETLISSCLLLGKDQGAGNSSFLPHGASPTHEMLSNVTQSNGLNYTAGGQETGDNHGTETQQM